MARQDSTLEATEDMLVEAWQLLMRLPDRERGFLASGSRTCLPQPIRDVITDYADLDARPRPQLGRRDMALVHEVFLAPRCLMMLVEPQHARLFGMVLAAKAGRMAAGFDWSDIWERMGGRRCKATSDGLRARYEGCLRRIATVLALAEMAQHAA